MGSSNRDYMQSDYDSGQPAWGHDVPTTKWLLVVTVVVFFLQTLLTHDVNHFEPAGSGVAVVNGGISTAGEQSARPSSRPEVNSGFMIPMSKIGSRSTRTKCFRVRSGGC